MNRKNLITILTKCRMAQNLALYVTFFTYFNCEFIASAISQDTGFPKGLETWKFNILYGEIVIVEGGFVKSDKSQSVRVDIGGDKVVDAVISDFFISKVVYAEPTITCIADFASCKDNPGSKVNVKVYHFGSREELDAESDGLFVLSYDLFGRFYFFYSHQNFDKASLQKLLNERSSIRSAWKNAFLPQLDK